MSVDCRAEFEVENHGEVIHAVRLREWLDGLPDGAVVIPIMRDLGTQRDPEDTMVGMRATWSEQRP